jgi:hypothetical protein
MPSSITLIDALSPYVRRIIEDGKLKVQTRTEITEDWDTIWERRLSDDGDIREESLRVANLEDMKKHIPNEKRERKYKVGLFIYGTEHFLVSVMDELQQEFYEKQNNFSKWLTDWVKYEEN